MRTLLSILFIFCILSTIEAQDHPVDKGAQIISADISFSSASGDLFEDANGDSYNTFEAQVGYDIFVIPNLTVGGGIGASYTGQGDASSTSFQIGPSISYFIGRSGSSVYPFVGAGFYYLTTTTDFGTEDITFSGTDILLGGGVLVPVKDHIGVTFRIAYDIVNLTESESDESFDGNSFSIGVGISGLLY